MSNIEEKRENLNDSRKTFENMSQDFTSLDYVNLKIAPRPVKFYKLIHCEKSKMHDYKYISEKIRANSMSTSLILVLFLKCNSRDEIKIVNEADWKKYFESQTMMELIDSKNTLKIEYIYVKDTELREMLNESDKAELDILKIVFDFALENESVKSKIKEELIAKSVGSAKSIENITNSRYYDVFLRKFFDKTLDKINNISELKSTLLMNDDNENMETGEGIEFDNDYEEDVPPFSEFYKDDQIEVFRSKILSETFVDFKDFNKKY